MAKKKYPYVERLKYGRYVAKPIGETIAGDYYAFKGGIGGKHNYRSISPLEYAVLRIKYWLLRNIFKGRYNAIVAASWK